jgi:four helix bundle protein
MNAEDLKQRIKQYAYRCINVCETLPEGNKSKIISGQLIRSSLSGAANYRAAMRAQSKKQFLAKLNIALEEIDESSFWLEAIIDLKLISIEKLKSLFDESIELTKILSATKNTTMKNLKSAITNQKS